MNEAVTQYVPGDSEGSLLASSGEGAPKTQIIAIYGKGGIGKSFTLANLSYMMAQQGKKVLLIGCDPKSDTTSLLFGGKACPTIIETILTEKSRRRRSGQIGDVCFKRDGVFAMELGGPEVGRGCGGRGIIHGFETLEKLGFHDWDFDYVLLDFLGDVVCGGFGLPIARDMCQKVIVVGSNDLQSLYVANNVCSAVEYFRKLGGNVGVAGMVINKDDGTGEAAAFCEGWASRSWPRFPQTKTSGARAPTTRLSVDPTASGVRCLQPWRSRSKSHRRSSPRP
jgi:chlorophyllide a reductase subunit X